MDNDLFWLIPLTISIVTTCLSTYHIGYEAGRKVAGDHSSTDNQSTGH